MNNRVLELNDNWYIATDENNEGMTAGWEKDIPADAVKAFVPSIIQQFFPEYHGVAYYWCRFTPTVLKSETDRLFLRLGGVDYKADVWLNGVFLGARECPETPFEFDVTDGVRDGENLLTVRVLNPCDRTVDGLNLLNTPHRNKTIKKQAGSNLNHGGIWYGVSLESRPAAYVSDVFLIPDSKSERVSVKTALCCANAADDCTLSVSVRDLSYADGEVARIAKTLSLVGGESVCECSVTVPNYKLWSVDSPNLYAVEIALSSPFGEHRVTHKIGFREFLVKDGFFYLNGKKIYIKSAHTGNAFPIGQMLPVHPDQLRKDLIYAKSCGFNMIRSIAGMLRPEQIDLADEIGLLIYEECLASWCVGDSQKNKWHDAESYAEACAKCPEMPLGDEKAMLARWRSNTEHMILRDRNHPSVVVWGLLNETMDNGVFREAVQFLERARELDPTRLVILNSGRFDHDMSVGSACNPYGLRWENTWGYDGDPDALKNAENEGQKNRFMGDNHCYGNVPMTESLIDLYRNFGKDCLPYFKSEHGIGPLFNVIDEYRHFKPHGERLDLEDCSWLAYQSEAFSRDFERLGLGKLFAFPERLLRESQRISAMDRRMSFDVFRSNPRVCGYSLTGLLDHGMCGEGLWTYWREWKPEVFDAVSDGWAPLRFCLFASHNVYCGEPIEIEAVLANDGVLSDGTYRADLAIVGENGVVYSESVDFPLDGNEFAVPITKKTLSLDLPRGKYKLVAELRDASARCGELEFAIRDKADNKIGNAAVATLGLGSKTRGYLSEIGVDVTEWDGGACDLLLVGDATRDTANRAIDFAQEGGTVLFLSKEIWLNAEGNTIEAARRVVSDLSLRSCPHWLYHPECVLNERQVFAGMDGGLARLRDMGAVFPSHGFVTETTPDYPLCPMLATGYYAAEMSYMLAHAVMGYRYGKGCVFFSTLELRHNIGYSTADRILSGLVNYLSDLKN